MAARIDYQQPGLVEAGRAAQDALRERTLRSTRDDYPGDVLVTAGLEAKKGETPRAPGTIAGSSRGKPPPAPGQTERLTDNKSAIQYAVAFAKALKGNQDATDQAKTQQTGDSLS